MASNAAEIIGTVPGSEPIRNVDRSCTEVGELTCNQDTRRTRVAPDVVPVRRSILVAVITGLLDPVAGSAIPVVDVVAAAPLGAAGPTRSLPDKSRVVPVLVETHRLGNPHGEHELALLAALY